jgi:hypothetical protein
MGLFSNIGYITTGLTILFIILGIVLLIAKSTTFGVIFLVLGILFAIGKIVSYVFFKATPMGRAASLGMKFADKAGDYVDLARGYSDKASDYVNTASDTAREYATTVSSNIGNQIQQLPQLQQPIGNYVNTAASNIGNQLQQLQQPIGNYVNTAASNIGNQLQQLQQPVMQQLPVMQPMSYFPMYEMGYSPYM